MRELYRRIGVLLLLFLAVAFYFSVRDDYIRLRPVDIGREYRSAYAPSRGWGATGAARSFLRSTRSFETVASFLDALTEGRLAQVEGEAWRAVFDGVEPSSGQSPFVERMGVDSPGGGYYFLPEEEPFPLLFREMKVSDQSFRYLKFSSPSGPRFLGMTLKGPRDAIDEGTPVFLLRPFRHLTAVPLLFALVLYIFPPRKKAAPGALVYPKWSAVLFPDLLGLILSGIFFAFPFFLTPAIFDSGNVLDFSEGNAWFTLVFWAIGMIFASMLYWSAKYASFSLEFFPGGMTIRTLGREDRIPYVGIEIVDFADYRPPRWLRTALFFASLVNWRMAGHSLLLSGRSDWGIAFRMKGGGTVKLLCSGLPGAERIFEALRRKGVPISPELESVLA
jgi:hypothetical protein